MNDSQTIFDQLKQPLEVKRIKKRQGGSGMQLSYIETHDAISTLNRIFGYDGWSYTLLEFAQFPAVKGCIFRQSLCLTVRFPDKEVVREDVGIGVASGNTSNDLEKAIKEAVSDALKRAARTLGEQFANSLYDKEAPEHKGQQQAPRATTAQLQECEALRQKAVQLGFRTKSGAEPKKTEDGAEENVVLSKIDAFRKYIQEHGDKGAPSTTPRMDALEDALGNSEGFDRFRRACTGKRLGFRTDADIAAFEDKATANAGDSGLAVVAEDLKDTDWDDYAMQVEEGFLSWGTS